MGFVKKCSRCLQDKPLDEFHRRTDRPDGWRSECKACAMDRWRAYRESNPLDTGPRTLTCPHCDKSFTYTKVTKARVYCTERCRVQSADAKKLDRAGQFVRACACGSTDVARVGKPVCSNCKIDKRDPARERAKERRRTLRLYSITAERFDELLVAQHGCCAICGTNDPGGRPWHIDHDHACCRGKGSCGQCVRGLLCTNCNLLLGHAGDNPARLLQAIHYLQRHQPALSA